MNVDKRIKPALVDPIIRQKIIKTIKPSKVNYWAPTKNTAEYFYEDYIRPNLFSVILIGIFVMILIYRYAMTQKDKLLREFNNDKKLKILIWRWRCVCIIIKKNYHWNQNTN